METFSNSSVLVRMLLHVVEVGTVFGPLYFREVFSSSNLKPFCLIWKFRGTDYANDEI